MAERDKKLFICKTCKKVFTTSSAMLRHHREKHQGIRVTCGICGHQTARQTDLADHVRRKHPSSASAPRRPTPACTQTPAKRRQMADLDADWLPQYRIPKKRGPGPMQPVVRLPKLEATPRTSPATSSSPATPWMAPSSTISRPPPSPDKEATVIHPASPPPPPTPVQQRPKTPDLESPPLATRTIVKLNLSATNSPVPSPDSPPGVRSGFVHSMDKEDVPPDTDSEGTKATKNLMKIMEEFASQLPTVPSPATPVQDELLVPADQGNIVSVQPLATSADTPVKEEPADPTAQAPAQPPQEPAAQAPAPESQPSSGQSSQESRQVAFNGVLQINENDFQINIQGSQCSIM